MYLSKNNHAARHIPYKKLLRDDNENPVGILPQAFEMRIEKNEKALSVNWLEYFGESRPANIIKLVKSFRNTRKVGYDCAFGIGNVGVLEETCAEHQHTKVRVLHDGKKGLKNNESHSQIIRLPINDSAIMQSLATKVFIELVPNKSIP